MAVGGVILDNCLLDNKYYVWYIFTMTTVNFAIVVQAIDVFVTRNLNYLIWQNPEISHLVSVQAFFPLKKKEAAELI